jgi:hypothetical protein
MKAYSSTLKMKTKFSSEKSVDFHRTTPRYTVRTIISAPPLQNAVSHTSAGRMQLLLCRSPIAVV